MTILDVAAKAVEGDRQRDYGSPEDNHGVTGRLWTVYVQERTKAAGIFEINAEDVCYLNVLQKIARTIYGETTLDGLADMAGFARNIEMMIDARDLATFMPEKPPENTTYSSSVSVSGTLKDMKAYHPCLPDSNEANEPGGAV